MEKSLQDLIDLVEKYKLVLSIVEGKKDKASLEKLGFENIITMEGKSTVEVVESVDAKTVMILTDFDVEGQKKYAALKSAFSERGVNVDDSFRKAVRKTHIICFEGLANFVQRDV